MRADTGGVPGARLIFPATLLAPLGLAVLAGLAPVPAPADDTPKPLKVRFYSADPARTLIGGIFFKPLRAGPRPGVVMLHGCGGMLTRSGRIKRRPAFWSRWLLDKGYAVLLADSFSPRGITGGICRTAERPVHPDRERPYDAYGALQFLQAQPEVIAGRIAVMGWSNGAMTLLWALRKGAPKRPRGLVAGFRAAVAFYPGCRKLGRSPYRNDVPTLLQLGLADDWTAPAPCLALTREASRAGVPIDADAYPGAYHGFDHPSSPVRTLETRYGSSIRQVHVGTDLAARTAAVLRVDGFLRKHLVR